MRRHLILMLIAIIAPLLVDRAVLVTTVFAQVNQTDQQLIARLDDLLRPKGLRNTSVGKFICQNLSLAPVGNCEVYTIGYKDDGEVYGHAIATYDEPGTRLRRFIMYFASAPYSEAYLVGRDGRLERATMKKATPPNQVWSPLSLDQASAGFKKELEYWRRKQRDLAKESDTKN